MDRACAVRGRPRNKTPTTSDGRRRFIRTSFVLFPVAVVSKISFALTMSQCHDTWSTMWPNDECEASKSCRVDEGWTRFQRLSLIPCSIHNLCRTLLQRNRCLCLDLAPLGKTKGPRTRSLRPALACATSRKQVFVDADRLQCGKRARTPVPIEGKG